MPYVRYVCLGFVVAALTVFAAFLALTGLNSLVEHTQIAKRGVTATGVVTKLEKIGGRSTRYSVDYRFTAKSGSKHAGQSDVDATMFKTLIVGRPITLKYLPMHPNINEAADSAMLLVALMKLFAAAMIGLIALLNFRTWRLLHAQIGWSPGRGWPDLLQTSHKNGIALG